MHVTKEETAYELTWLGYGGLRRWSFLTDHCLELSSIMLPAYNLLQFSQWMYLVVAETLHHQINWELIKVCADFHSAKMFHKELLSPLLLSLLRCVPVFMTIAGSSVFSSAPVASRQDAPWLPICVKWLYTIRPPNRNSLLSTANVFEHELWTASTIPHLVQVQASGARCSATGKNT